MKYFSILLFFLFHEVCSVCFVKENTTKSFNYIGNIKGSDEYRCRITCAEREECQSFGVVGNHCTMYGASRFHWVDVHEEWFKKTSEADCPDQMKQPLITELYYPSRAIKYFTDLDEFEMECNTWQACPKGWMLDVILLNHTRRIEGDVFNHIHWNGSIGAWILTKKTVQSNTESCFGTLPTIPTGQVTDKPVKLNGVYFESCGRFQFITDFDTRRNATYLRDQVLVCVDRS